MDGEISPAVHVCAFALDTVSVTSPVERYELEGLIGRGGLGEVLLARDTLLGRLVAIKRLHTPEADGQNLSELALREARVLASLLHPNIVTIFDIFPYGRDMLVAMEYVKGRNLQEIGEHAPVAVDDFIEVARQSLQALHAAHSHGILHRDIKPGNIMVADTGEPSLVVKVLDFGLAKLAESVRQGSDGSGGEVVGSVYTMAPEQFEQRGEDCRTDLYSLGCVLYFILVGEYPFRGKDVNSVILAHLDHLVEPIQNLRADLPQALAQWLMTLLEADPERRPASSMAALQALYKASGGGYVI